jgi:hypothetical protein
LARLRPQSDRSGHTTNTQSKATTHSRSSSYFGLSPAGILRTRKNGSQKKSTHRKKITFLGPCAFRPLPALKPKIIGEFGWSILLKLKTRADPPLSLPVLTFIRMLVVFSFQLKLFQMKEKMMLKIHQIFL